MLAIFDERKIFLETNCRKYAILTYHRVADNRSDWNFYDVSWRSFERQLAMLAARQQRPAPASLRIELDFDDGTEDHARVGERLAQHALHATFFVVTDWIGRPGFLSRSDLRSLVRSGHTIGSHTVSHPRLTTLRHTDLRVELERSKKHLEDLTGQAVTAFAAPGGYLDDRAVEAAFALGYRSVRSMDWGYNSDKAAPYAARRAIPLFSTTSDARYAAILSGRARFTAFRLKQALKALAGETAYIRMRDAAGRLRRSS